MTIEKAKLFKNFILFNISISILILSLTGCTKMYLGSDFRVHGDPELLKQMVINVETTRDHTNPPYAEGKLDTILYQGKEYESRNSDFLSTRVFASYQNRLIGTFDFDNLPPGERTDFYVYEKNQKIYVATTQDAFYPPRGGVILRPKAEVFQEIIGFTEKKHSSYLETRLFGKIIEDEPAIYNRFFGFFDPELTTYIKMPLGLHTVEQYKQHPKMREEDGISLQDLERYE